MARRNECLQPSVKSGGESVLVWDYFSASGVGDVARIIETMNAKR